MCNRKEDTLLKNNRKAENSNKFLKQEYEPLYQI